MKLILDPMPSLREARKAAVNAAFNALAQPHVDQAHAIKRQWAAWDDRRLEPEAQARGISVAELAAIIRSKPDVFAERELQRQRIMLAIDAATTPAELAAIHISSEVGS